jgi:hypothetical protein
MTQSGHSSSRHAGLPLSTYVASSTPVAGSTTQGDRNLNLPHSEHIFCQRKRPFAPGNSPLAQRIAALHTFMLWRGGAETALSSTLVTRHLVPGVGRSDMASKKKKMLERNGSPLWGWSVGAVLVTAVMFLGYRTVQTEPHLKAVQSELDSAKDEAVRAKSGAADSNKSPKTPVKARKR